MNTYICVCYYRVHTPEKGEVVGLGGNTASLVALLTAKDDTTLLSYVVVYETRRRNIPITVEVYADDRPYRGNRGCM